MTRDEWIIRETQRPPRDLEAFRRAKAEVDHALELRRQARAAETEQEQPLDEGGVG